MEGSNEVTVNKKEKSLKMKRDVLRYNKDGLRKATTCG